MPDPHSLDVYSNHMATHHERASLFIDDGMNASDRDMAIAMATSFIDPNKPVAKTAVLIPVAAHQDSDVIIPTLGEYARQKTDSPFTVFLHLNAPFDSTDYKKVEAAEENVAKARELFPELDVRSATNYYDNAPIGEIRRDLWNAAFLLSYHEHGFNSGDVIGINNDIDAQRISPHYIARIQEFYERRTDKRRKLLGDRIADRAVQGWAATRVTHAVLPSHPNTGKVTSWVDNTSFQAPGHLSYEAGVVIPFSTYAHLSGFNSESVTHETSWIFEGNYSGYVSGAQLYTSPRRYIDRLRHHDTSEIWTNDSFGANDACRAVLPEDINTERAEEVIFERLADDLTQYWLPGVLIETVARPMLNRKLLGDITEAYAEGMVSAATGKVERQLAKAERLLRKMVGSDLLADIVKENYDAASSAREQVALMKQAIETGELE